MGRLGLFATGLALTVFVAGCTPGGGGGSRLGDVEQLNGETGSLAKFTFPYYTSILALPGGGAIATWMRHEPPFRPLVYRIAPDADSPFGDEGYLGTEKFEETISVVPSVVPGPGEQTLYATWQSRFPTSGEKWVVFRRSDDHGRTWTEEHTLNTQSTAFIPSIGTDTDGGVYIAWTDERDHKRRIFFNRSLDGGRTWLEKDVDLEASDPEAGGAVALDLATDGSGRVAVVWERQAGRGRQVQVVVSEDRGATWSPVTAVNDHVPGRYSPTAPRVEIVNGHVIVVWTAAATNSVARVWSDVLAAGSDGWGEDVLVYEAEKGLPANTDLRSRDGVAHLVFSTGPYRGNWHIYHTRSNADGSWTATGADVRAVTKGDGRFSNPRLAIGAEQRLALAFVQKHEQVFLAESPDGGDTWNDAQLLYEVPAEETGVTARYPQVSVADGVAYVIWEKWANRKPVFNTLADADTKTVPADLFVRRAVLGK